MSTDAEMTFSHAEAFDRLQGELGWGGDDWAEEILSEGYARRVGVLLETPVRDDSEQATLLSGIKEILDHHESRIRRAVLTEDQPGHSYEEACQLGVLMDKLARRYAGAIDGESISVEEAEAYVGQAERYREEVLFMVDGNVTRAFGEIPLEKKVAWYSEYFA